MHIYKYAYNYVFFSSSISNLHNDIIHLQFFVIGDEDSAACAFALVFDHLGGNSKLRRFLHRLMSDRERCEDQHHASRVHRYLMRPLELLEGFPKPAILE